MGAKGKVDQKIVDEVLSGPCFKHEIRKTTGRETFGDQMAEDICDRTIKEGYTPEDCVAKITRITAQGLAEGYKSFRPPGGINEIFMGGGSYHPNIVNCLREQLPKTRFTTIDKIGIPVGPKKALGFALLGVEGFVGRPMIVPKRIQSDRPGVIGQIQPGENHHRIRKHICKVSSASQDPGSRRRRC
jgi:1,6-anhydro-N-acetylmuramate kinase